MKDNERESELDALNVSAENQRLEFEHNDLLAAVKTQKERQHSGKQTRTQPDGGASSSRQSDSKTRGDSRWPGGASGEPSDYWN